MTFDNDDDVCWICHGGGEAHAPLITPCHCNLPVHLRCLAHWQLINAGKR